MTLEAVLDVLGSVMILIGAGFTLTAAIGLVRLPDVLNRMHAASKPQTLGFLLLCSGLAIVLRDPGATTMLILAAGMQLVTAPVATQMMGKAAYRTGQFRSDIVVVDDRTPEDEPDDEAETDEERRTG
ncbi:multisubunit sodium/proton antiporter, MrpG subunit [Agrococcus baldri]|uniref:Multisubunit sodium/proton antiporter, MrpG subunit n=1 Tax=Agrococcus baldri TaxID=153730 RepID=A0AA94HNC4_9MICO|nr:monovalent cation/H(+) antiporter subunit G [Agrococcus baldri]SFS15284.1 multisubunit sodium/proton antiporter, MrpG subunit [Agrococcus baldri]